MSEFSVTTLSNDHSFGARVSGVTLASLQNQTAREQLAQLFEDRGLIVFDGGEDSSEMHVALSEVFGPLQQHAFKGIPLVDNKTLPGVVNIASDPAEADMFEVEGRLLSSWIPWHFDACYTARLNRGGILRALTVPPEGGMTGFADGVQIYNDLSPELRDRFANLEILYHPALMFMDLRFGRPDFQVVRLHQSKRDMIAGMKDAPRSIHPAIWQRPSGEFVMHVSPWQADGIVGMETPEGDELLEELCQEILAAMRPYLHPWKPREMLVWDNWRLLHSALGHDPAYPRHMHRTTIEGDYGLGRFEPGGNHAAPVPVMD